VLLQKQNRSAFQTEIWDNLYLIMVKEFLNVRNHRQNRFPDHSLCYRCDIAFHFSSVVVAALLGSGFVGFEHSKALQS
jgi:hypothetical protein